MGLDFGFGYGLNRSARMPGEPPVPGYLGPVASRNILPNNYFNGHLQARSRSVHWAREALTSIKLLLPNWYIDGTGNLVGPGASREWRASIEYPANTFTQVTFGGAAGGIVANGANIESDFVDVDIPDNAQFWVRLWTECAGGTIWTSLTAFKSTAIFGEAFGSAASGITDLTMTAGAVPDAGNASNYMGPLAILGMTEADTVIYFGDSIAAGLNDTNNESGDFGIFRYLSANYGYINASRSSDRAQWAAGRGASYYELAKYCSHAIIQHSINDLVASRTAVQVEADLVTIANAVKAVKPSIKLSVTTVTPDTDAGNTTPNATTTAPKETLNRWKRTTPAPFNDVIDFALAFEVWGLWNNTTYTADGRHTTKAGNLSLINNPLISQNLIFVDSIPDPFIANAAHFTEQVILADTPQVAITSSVFSFSAWVRPTVADSAGSIIRIIDTANDYRIILGFTSGRPYLWVKHGSDNAYARFDTDVTTGVWHHIAASVNINAAGGSRTFNLYVDGATETLILDDTGAAFSVNLSAADYFGVGTGEFGPNFEGDLSELWVAAEFIDFSLLSNRQKFRNASGKPVYLGFDGSTPTGNIPLLYFSNPYTGFGVNRGFGPDLYLASGALTAASYSPSEDPPPVVGQTLFDQTTVIGMTKAADTADYMMGVQMQFAVDGYIDRVSIWKPAGSSITLSRLGGVWNAAGTTKLKSGQLASAGEPAEPAWVHMPLDTPLAVTAGTVYKLGIRVPDGSYSAQSGGLTSAIVRGDLTAPASAGVSPGNGIFATGSSDVVPNQTFGSTNYYVDTAFYPGAIPTMPPAGYPDATNTGPTGALSASGSVSSSANGQIIENLDIAGSVTITHANVTLRNCKVSLYDDASLIVSATGANVTIENCLIDGLAGSYVGIYVEAGGSITACEIRNFENGILSNGNTTVSDTYIHSMTSTAAAPHYDCFECNGGSNVTLTHNTFVCEQDQTSCVMFDNLYSGLSNITVNDNVLIGGGYTLYCDGQFGGGVVDNATINITNNKMVPGQYGYFAFTSTNPTATGNVNAYSGLAFR